MLFSGRIGLPRRRRVRRLIHRERKLRLRIFRMHQERRPPIHVAPQQAQAFVGSVPRLHHDVVQFIAQEVFDHALVLRLDLEEVGQHARRSESTLQRSRLEQPPHRLGRVSMLGDDRFERSLLPQGRRKLGAQAVQSTASPRSPRAACSRAYCAQFCDLGSKPAHPLRDSFKFQCKLPALPAKRLHLRRSRRDFILQPLRFAIHRRQSLFRLRKLIAQVAKPRPLLP